MKVLVAAVVAFMSLATAAQASVTFVGSWELDNGPLWSNDPPTYTGQQAAALLFTGLPSDYLISTIDNNPAHINNLAWYSVLGYCPGSDPNSIDCGVQFAPNYVSPSSTQSGGLYYSGAPFAGGNINDAASAYVDDNAKGAKFTNFAFLVTPDRAVPEPLTLSLFGAGLAGAALIRRRKRI